MARLTGKVAVITGAARGQGAAEANPFVEEGAKVVLTDVLDDLGQRTASALGPNAIYIHHDVGAESEWKTIVGETVERLGQLDVLVNNAAILHLSALEETTLIDFERVVRVNQVGTFL